MNDLTLLDKAKNITGSDGKTAIKLGISKMRVSDIRNGRKSLTAAQAGVLAEITGGRWQDEAFRRLEALEATEEARSFWASKRLEMSSNSRRQSASRLSNKAVDNVVAIASNRKDKNTSVSATKSKSYTYRSHAGNFRRTVVSHDPISALFAQLCAPSLRLKIAA